MIPDSETQDKVTNNSESNMLNPTRMDKPAYLMDVPFTLNATVANNLWMKELKEDERKIDMNKALTQFFQLYHFIASDALVYLLPTPQNKKFQDLVYCANMGAVLDQLPDKNTVVLTNFSTQVRKPETKIGKSFFELMDYHVVTPPFHFEGEAEIKHLHDNVYIGGYGIRSDKKAYQWMMDNFDIKIITVEETEAYLYHLDCTVFPLTRQNTLVCTELFTSKEIKLVESETNIIDVSIDDCFSGICNSLRVGNSILNASNIMDIKKTDQYYDDEKHKNRSLEDIANQYAFELCFFNLSEYLKSGALLSCMVMHLNHHSYNIDLL